MYRQVQIIYKKQVFTKKINWRPAFDYNFLFSDADLIDTIYFILTLWLTKLQKVWFEGVFPLLKGTVQRKKRWIESASTVGDTIQ